MSTYEKLLKTSSRLIPSSQLSSFAKSVLLDAPQRRLVFVDASWYMPNVARSGGAEFLSKRIKVPADEGAGRTGSVKFGDVDGIKDAKSVYPHMLPSVGVFNDAMKSLDIKKNDTIVVYDLIGNFSAPRMAWMFEIFHKGSTFLLDTFPEYLSLVGEKAAFDTKEYKSMDEYLKETASASTQNPVFAAPEMDASRVILFEELKSIVTNKAELEKYILLDARSFGRFSGQDPEPRPGLSSGHVPGAVSLPFPEVLKSSESGFNRFKSPEELLEIFAKRGVTKQSVGEKQVIVMCGTGVSACVLERALRVAGLADGGSAGKLAKVYDGSWTEWAMRAPKELIVIDE